MKVILSNEELLFQVQNYYVIIVTVFSLGVAFFISKSWGRKAEIPGRLGLPFIGETLSFFSATNSTKGCYNFVKVRRLRYGKWFKTRILGKIHMFVPSTEGAKMIFTSDFANFNKGYVKSMADAVGKNSLLCVPHESHKRIRRLLSDPFSMNSLSKFVKTFDKMLSERLNKLQESGKSFSILDFSMKLTFDAMCNMLMSVTDDSLLGRIEKDCTAVSDAMLSFPFMIPGTRYYRGIKARRRLMETFRGMIAKRRSGEESFEDFLQSMLEKDSCPTNEKLSDSEIMDNLLTLIIAGQTTTAAAMMWSVKFLHDNREAQQKLREEQLAMTKDKAAGAALTLEDVSGMSYGLKVRHCFEIKKGWHVNIDAAYIHYDPALYKDPEQFNPSRFEEMQKSYSFIPFGSGPRTCLGMNMAKVTMLIFLHRLTSGYLWTVDDPDLSLEKKSHIPRLRSGCPITLKPLNKSKYARMVNKSK
ncbi:cytochrome P450 family 722 subfamily A polypeptide 1 [Citrus sinensis]|uniref:Cytochrome P450 family 722 subfamily A polypeptide 1 n=1 Tax=Citrus sinensis TaxID=2711 RepID=A0ACB8J167_CITSI|nr:cytochrome P450 family 722 subfamily A polypeptide 1 [Citrus sinensis]